jgi:uroporphyrinogen III methyltransferase/synthase
MIGKVFLVGAGPGDTGLMTVRGLKVLREADVIVYDNLASDALLNETRPTSEWIDAGKSAGHHRIKQEEIGKLLIEKARQGYLVVRLKGGDPFIFGRGGEEAMALVEAGIPFEVIPGISSSYAAAAYFGIPVTHRHVASSFHVITGHEDPTKESSSLDYRVLAKEEGTLVFLMGLSRIRTIAEMLIANGKAAETPSAVISKGTTARQKLVTAPLCEMADVVAKAAIQPPAILLVGDVVSLQEKIAWQQDRPLSGKKILITATGEIARRLGEQISELGGEAVPMSLIGIRPIENLHIKEILAAASEDAWLVFTSRNGVGVFFEQLKKERIDVRLLGKKRIAVIGRGTEEALADYGYYADLVPETSCSESLAEALCQQADTDSDVLLFRAKEAADILPEKLAKTGIHCVDTALYVTEIQAKKAQLLQHVLADVDVVTFCSASAVRAFASMTEDSAFCAKTACIGPVTAKAAEKCGLRVDVMAKHYHLDGLVRSVLDICQKSNQ